MSIGEVSIPACVPSLLSVYWRKALWYKQTARVSRGLMTRNTTWVLFTLHCLRSGPDQLSGLGLTLQHTLAVAWGRHDRHTRKPEPLVDGFLRFERASRKQLRDTAMASGKSILPLVKLPADGFCTHDWEAYNGEVAGPGHSNRHIAINSMFVVSLKIGLADQRHWMNSSYPISKTPSSRPYVKRSII